MKLGNLSLSMLVLAATACGGTSGGAPVEPVEAGVQVQVDPGSGAIQCPERQADGTFVVSDYAGRESRYVFDTLEDWEFGAAASSWYSNNSQCSICDEQLTACNAVDGDADQTCDDPAAEAERLACEDRCKAIQEPWARSKPIPADEIPNGGRCGSYYALHLQAGPFDEVPFAFNESWGGVLGQDWHAEPRDLSAYEGVFLWGRAAPWSRKPFRVDLSDPFTDGNSLKEDGTPYCGASDEPGTGCDKFGWSAPLGDDWQLFLIPFSEMRQGGWGEPAPFLTFWEVWSFGFSYNVGVWDLWIDDIGFYRLASR
jgi:hypothetical protein